MRIDIRELEDGQNLLEWDETPAELDLDLPDVSFAGPIHTAAVVTKLGPSLSIAGSSRYTIGAPCARCDEPIRLSFEAPFSFILQKGRPRGMEGDEDESLIFLDEEGDEVDLGREVRDYILLELPMNPVCAEYAAGTCPNAKQIEQAERRVKGEGETDPRWSALKTLKG